MKPYYIFYTISTWTYAILRPASQHVGASNRRARQPISPRKSCNRYRSGLCRRRDWERQSSGNIPLARNGCSVVCVNLNWEWAEKTVAMIVAERLGTAVSCVAHVSVPEQCQNTVNTAISEFGRLDILVNKVGIPGELGSVVEVDIVKWRHAFAVNLESVVPMSRYSITEMLQTGETRCSDASYSSIAGLSGSPSSILAYATNKGAILNLTKTKAPQHDKQGICVNCVFPGKSPLIA